VQFNVTQREIVIKVVYYGPPLSGKTTNLQALHRLLDPKVRGRLTTLDTSDDRTLFFDLLPIVMSSGAGHRIKLKLFTVPGQVIHAATRRLVLAGADGVIFVADSQRREARVNNQYWHGMRQYLTDNGLDPDVMPTVLQFNKRDLPGVRTDAELKKMREQSPEPIFEAVATKGEGVAETLVGLLRLVYADLNKRHDFQQKFNISLNEFVTGLLPIRPVDRQDSPEEYG